MRALISVQGQALFLLTTGLFLGSLLLELLRSYKQWSIQQVRAPASVIWSSGWQLRDGNPRAGLKPGTFRGSVTALSAHHSPATHSAFLSQKSIPRNLSQSQCFWIWHVPISQHCAMKHWYREDMFLTISSQNQQNRDSNFIVFYMQVQRRLGLRLSAESRYV